jgi:hypothetical protein
MGPGHIQLPICLKILSDVLRHDQQQPLMLNQERAVNWARIAIEVALRRVMRTCGRPEAWTLLCWLTIRCSELVEKLLLQIIPDVLSAISARHYDSLNELVQCLRK